MKYCYASVKPLENTGLRISQGVANPLRVCEDCPEDHPEACMSHCSYQSAQCNNRGVPD